MALIFVDSFDHYASADIATKWNDRITATINSAAGRNGTSGLRCSGANHIVNKAVSNLSTIVVGVAVKFSSATVAATWLELLEGTTTHVDLRLRTDGKIDVTRNGTVLGTSTTAISAGSAYYVELKATIHDSTGAVTLRVNGTAEVTLTNQDTRNGQTGVITNVELQNTSNSQSIDFDDFYMLDTTGSAPNNDFLGDVRVQAILPNGNGNSSQLVGSDSNSTDNYLLVDEAAPNSDTDYVESATTGQKDTYAFASVTPTSGTVFGVQVSASARKTDAGSRNIKLVARPGSTDFASSAKALLVTYSYQSNIWEQNPDTTAAWTISEVNASEFGVEVA